MVDISVDSILHCDPSLPNQIVCLIIAGLVMMLVMKVIAKIVVAILERAPEAVTDRLLLEAINGLKMEEYAELTIDAFNKWSVENPDKANSIKDGPTIEDFVKRVDDGEFQSRDEATDAYMESRTRRNVWKEWLISCKALEMSMSIQHSFAGFFGLYAFLMAKDQDSFLTIARWGVLLEAGFELFDTIERVLLPIYKGEFEFGCLLAAFHHVTLYLFYPLNAILLPSEIGHDVALAIFLYAALPCLQTPIQFGKNYVDIDLTETKGKILYMTLSTISIFTLFLPRSVHWCYFAYITLSFAWDEFSWPAFALCVLCVFMFSLFNLFMCFFVYKGFVKAIEKVRRDDDEIKEQQEADGALVRARRRSTLMDTNMSSRNTISSRKSLSFMGVDIDLDDDEMQVFEARTSARVV